MSDTCIGVLLAAGQSRRFGANKLLHPIDSGVPMVVASARHLQAALGDVIAVVAERQSQVAVLLQAEGLAVVENPCADRGLGTSIACGVGARADARGWLIALGDMPYLPSALIRRLAIGLAQGADIIAPVYRAQRGHPVGFAARHGAALRQLRTDRGARGIVEQQRATLTLVEVHDPAVLRDIDRPQDLPVAQRTPLSA